MIAPAWLSNRTQPIAIDDVLAYLAQAPDVPELGAAARSRSAAPTCSPTARCSTAMADVLGVAAGRRLPVPLLTPWLSSLWIGLVTPVDAGVARPLVEGLSTPTVVTDPSGAALFDVEPTRGARSLC